MNTFIRFAAASAIALAAGAAQAQTAPSTADKPAEKGAAGQMTPKTTGAMDNAVKGTATSPQEVQKQNEGVGATGSASKDKKASPGTVGATPGTDAPQPQSK